MASGDGRLAGKVALVTGASSGLGAATARRFASEGAKVVLSDVAIAAGEALAHEIDQDGGKVAFIAHDVTDPAAWERAVGFATERFGGLHVLVNNAGIATDTTELMTHDLELWRRVVSINLDGVFLGLRYAGPAIAAAGGGSVVNLSSILGKVAMAGAAAYCASKGGVTLLTKAAALEWAALGIRVNSVHPGFIDTPMVSGVIQRSENGNEMRDLIISRHPLGRLGAAGEVAEAVLFLASDESRFVTGSELVIDGGYTAQ